MRKSVTVTAALTKISDASYSVGGSKKNFTSILIKNFGSNIVYLQWTRESDTLTKDNGFPLGANEVVAISRADDIAGKIFGITEIGTCDVRIAAD